MGGHKAAAGPAQDRYFYTPQRFYHIGSASIGIGKGISGIKYTAVDLPVKMFDEVAVDHGVPFVLYPAGINMKIRGSGGGINHGFLPQKPE
jgi:hypothetical protein